MKAWFRGGVLTACFSLASVAGFTAQAAEGERVQITGEVMDTWCYLSGVMGGPEATLGTSHHTCAIWCAAGGIPVGILGEDGELYMVLQLEGSGPASGSDTILSVQSNQVTADGMLYERDGLKYLIVEEIVADAGIVNETHDIYGTIPGFAIPKNVISEVTGE